MKAISKLVGRLLLSLIFLLSFFKKISGFEGTVQYMQAKGMTVLTEFWLIGAISLIGFGSFSLLLGWKMKWGGTALLVFLAAATLIFHTDFSQPGESVHFLKNVSIFGGILFTMFSDPAKYSIKTFNNFKIQNNEKI